MNGSSEVKDRYHYRYAALLVVLMGVGLWLRIRNLGHLSLIVDEGVQALAVEAILKNGAPRMESGVLYLRGPLYLYTQAALASLFQLNEFWLRLPSVVFGVAAIIPTYILGGDLFNRSVGVLSAIIIAISAWEIEMSRYARVYIAFQFFFLVSLIFFYRGFVVDEYRAKIWFLVVAFFAFLTHELSQVLGTLFLIPMFVPTLGWWKKLNIGFWAVGLAGLLYVARQFNGIFLPDTLSWASDGGASAPGIMNQITATLGIPTVNGPELRHFSYAVQHDFAAVLTLLLVGGGATMYLLYRLFQTEEGGKVTLGLLTVWAGMAYQFGLVLIFFVAYLALFARGSRILTDRTLLASLGAALVSFVGWFVLLLSSPDLILVEVPLVMFGFPAFYKYFLRWLVRGWPVMTVLLTAGSLLLFVRYLRDRQDKKSLFLLGALYIPALFASLFESSYGVVYILHLYPLVTLISSCIVWKISVLAWRYSRLQKVFQKRSSFILIVVAFLLVSQDTNITFAWKIGERTYQTEKPPVRNVISFSFYYDYHPDIKGASNYLKKNMSEGDKVLVFSPNHMLQIFDFYVGGVDFWITVEGKEKNRGVVRESEIVHYTSNCKGITSILEFDKVLDGSNNKVWIVGDYRTLNEYNPWFSNSKIKEKVRSLVENPDYVARDGITFVKRIP